MERSHLGIMYMDISIKIALFPLFIYRCNTKKAGFFFRDGKANLQINMEQQGASNSLKNIEKEKQS